MLGAALMSHHRLLLSRAGSRVVRPSMASTAAGFASRTAWPGRHGLLIQPPAVPQPPARPLPTLLHTVARPGPARPGPPGATAGRVMALGGATCVLLACAPAPASRQDFRTSSCYGNIAHRLLEFTEREGEGYMEQVRRLQPELGDLFTLIEGFEAESWEGYIENERVFLQKVIDIHAKYVGATMSREEAAAVRAALPGLRARVDEAAARFKALHGKLREHVSTSCPPKLQRAMGRFAASLPEGQLDAAGVASVRACLEPALQLLHSEAKPLVEVYNQVEDVVEMRSSS